MTDLVRLVTHDGWAEIQLARHDKRNALNREMRQSLASCLDRLEALARVVVITGTESSFCAGLDLKEREEDKAAGRVDTAGDEWMEVNTRVREHPAVFVAAVNGLALGAGVTLLNSCDLAIAANSARIGCPELGFATYAGMAGPTTQLTISRRHAAWLLLTAERIDAATALHWGLINEVVEPAHLAARAAELATHIAQFDRIALREVKKALNHIPAHIADWREAMEYGQQVNQNIRRETTAAAEGLARFARGERNIGQG
jgi:enoyl-CoA hydratase/carnithine racemase